MHKDDLPGLFVYCVTHAIISFSYCLMSTFKNTIATMKRRNNLHYIEVFRLLMFQWYVLIKYNFIEYFNSFNVIFVGVN